MSNDLKLTGTSSTNIDYDPSPEQPIGTQKKSGCGCFMVGCLIILAVIFLPIIGGGIYIATMDDAEWGGKIVTVLKNPDFVQGFKNGIQESDKINPDQKKALIALYDKFLTDYDNLSPQQQETINKNIFIVVKKIFINPQNFNKEPPKELTEIISVLKLESTFSNLKNTIQKDKTTSTTSTTTTPTNPPPSTTPPPTPPKPTTDSDYDF